MTTHTILRLPSLTALFLLLPAIAYACPSGPEHMLTSVTCNFMDALNQVKSQLLTRFYSKMAPIAQTLASLYILFYGIEILIGSAKFNSRDALGRMAKITIVVALMTGGSKFNFDDVYDFFIGLALEVPGYFIGSMPGAGSVGLNGSGMSLINGFFGNIDSTLAMVVQAGGNNKLFGVEAVKLIGFCIAAAIAVPQIFGLFFQLLQEIVTLIAEVLLHVLMALAAITFLTAMGPLFVGFYLFQQTKSLCESWIRHLVAYSLQVIFVLAAFALWVAVITQYKSFFTTVNQAVNPWVKVTSAAPGPTGEIDTWSACAGVKSGNRTPTYTCQGGAISLPAMVNDTSQTGDQGRGFITYMVYYLTTFVMLCYAFAMLIKQATGIAEQIAGGGGGGGLDGFGLGAIGKKGPNLERTQQKIGRKDDEESGAKGASDKLKESDHLKSTMQSISEMIRKRPTPGSSERKK